MKYLAIVLLLMGCCPCNTKVDIEAKRASCLFQLNTLLDNKKINFKELISEECRKDQECLHQFANNYINNWVNNCVKNQ